MDNISTIIDKLTTDYDMKYYSSLPIDIQDEIFQMCKDNRINNSILCTMIKNTHDQTMNMIKKVKKIYGPMSFYNLEGDDKKIILFGEYHKSVKGNKCKDNNGNKTSVDNFLKFNIENNNNFIDLFVEFHDYFYPYREDRKNFIFNQTTTLSNIVKELYEYACKDRVDNPIVSCISGNLRLHSIDSRGYNFWHYLINNKIKYLNKYDDFIISFIGLIVLSFHLNNLYDNLQNTPKFDQYLKNIHKCAEIFLQTYVPEFFTNFDTFYNIINNHLFPLVKIDKQIDNIKNIDLKNQIIDIFKNDLKNYFKDIEGKGELIANDIFYYKNNEPHINLKTFIKKFSSYLLYNGFLVDFYLISRIFRNFSGGIYNLSPKNIIIYAGDAHISKYVEILSTLNFQEKYSRKNYMIKNIEGFVDHELFQCLDISALPQPLFSD